MQKEWMYGRYADESAVDLSKLNGGLRNWRYQCMFLR